jgi:hypothetical protein
MKNNKMNEQITLTMYFKIIYNRMYFSANFLHTKRFGLIEKFFYSNVLVYVIARKIVLICNPFFTQKYPKLKAKLSICAVSTDYFIEEVRKIQKRVL